MIFLRSTKDFVIQEALKLKITAKTCDTDH